MIQRAALFGLCCLLLAQWTADARAQAPRVVARSIYHSDHSHTEIVTNPEIREMTEATYSANNVLTSRKVLLLNERGDPTQGNVYDGRGQLVARVRCLFDSFGRRSEDQLITLQGEVFQRVLYEVDAKGKPQPPKVINLQVASAPSIRPQSIDFTNSNSPMPTAQAGADRYAPQRVNGSAGQSPAPAAGAASTGSAGQQPASKKGGFFQRLLKR